MVTYNDKILVPNSAKDGLDTIHPETNTGNVYDFKNNGWLSETFEEVKSTLTTHLEDDEVHVTKAKTTKWDNTSLDVASNKTLWNNKRNTFADNSISDNPDTDARPNFLCKSLMMGDNGVNFWYIEQTTYSTNKMQQATSYAGNQPTFKVRHNYQGTWSPWSPDLYSLFQSVSNGKAQVANAITQKGVTTAPTAEFATMASNISRIETGKKFAIGRKTVISNRPGYAASWLKIDNLGFVPVTVVAKRVGANGNMNQHAVFASDFNHSTGDIKCYTNSSEVTYSSSGSGWVIEENVFWLQVDSPNGAEYEWRAYGL